MIAFILLAIALTAAAVGAIVVPLLRRTERLPAPATWAAAAAAGVLMVGAAVLYAVLSNYSWNATPPSPADSPAQMVAHLVQRLESNPNDLDGWLMLGRSYVVLENLDAAIRA